MTGNEFYRRHGKRLLDVAVAGVGLVVAAPVLAGVAVAVRARIGTPVVFRQTRPGLDGEPFELLKFRTMSDERDDHGVLLPDAQRLDSFGVWLRSTSLDELPELVNVVRGHMSLVGPRPLLMEYLPLYDQTQIRRHEVRPGITGLAQVTGRNATSWTDRLAADVEYVERVSLRLDVAILWRTVRAVVSRVGIVHDGHATMPAFRGKAESVSDEPGQGPQSS